MDERPKISISLTGVPETLLWTLYFRAQEARRVDAVLHDPLAVELVERIDYPFAERLGEGQGRAQWQGLRARTFDQRIEAFARACPGGTVVALGEGLETQFWRVDDGQLHWIGVDLPAAAKIRRQVLPAHARHRQVTGSVLDDAWMDTVDASRGLVISAQGLLMYLSQGQVHDLFVRCARRFPGAQMVFDGVPRWTSWVTQKTASLPATGTAMKAPPMPWSMDSWEASALRSLPGVSDVTRLHPPQGRGLLFGTAAPALDRLPLARDVVLSIWAARF